jgi:hypothetical protein
VGCLEAGRVSTKRLDRRYRFEGPEVRSTPRKTLGGAFRGATSDFGQLRYPASS